MNILGISSFYGQRGLLVSDGDIVAAAQEELFTRKKHDPRFPKHAINFCLREGYLDINQVDYIAFYDKPLVKYERLLLTYLATAPHGYRSFLSQMPSWLKEKLFVRNTIRRN